MSKLSTPESPAGKSISVDPIFDGSRVPLVLAGGLRALDIVKP